jgi:Protein of unknown function (DUF1553)/Protein of unknown function (DUF1549)/Bacterial Ig-like domain (group 2)
MVPQGFLPRLGFPLILAAILGPIAWKVAFQRSFEPANVARAGAPAEPPIEKRQNPPEPVAPRSTPVSPGALRPSPEKPLSGIVQLRVEPAVLNLDGPRDSRRFVVRGQTEAGVWIDLTHRCTSTIAGDAVRLENDYLYPVKNGTAEVLIAIDGREARLPVTVTHQASAQPVSFVNDVMPILGKSGCNAGTCHGAAKGRNGFKLSLRGYDPGFDHEQIVEDLAGRRIDRKESANSLVLLKPTQAAPHEGKLVFDENSRYYKILHQWIADGCASDVGVARRVERIQILPRDPVLSDSAARQQLIVIAHFPDGATRDVTRDAIYSSSADSVATVSGDGLVRAVRKGETAILVRYEGQFAVNPVSVLIPDPKYKWTDPPVHNYIDELVYRKHRRQELLPSGLCSDPDFLRRVYLDLIGMPPTPEEARAFLGDRRDTLVKRREVVDRLLARPEYIDFQTLRLADLMQVNRKYLGERGMLAFRDFLRQQVAADKPWDETAAALLTGGAASPDAPRGAFFKIAPEPGQAVENTTHLFLGIRFNCNKCHDHPFERWTWNNYYELAAFFSDKNDVKHPRTGQVVAPRFPFVHAGYDAKAAASGTRQQQLSRWLTSAENPYFARSMANRLWATMIGSGIIEPVDDIRAANPPSNPELLDALAADFVKNKFSIKHLLRTIANSRTYQLSIEPNATNAEDVDNFARARPRRLTAEQMLDSVRVATGTKNEFPGFPVGTRAAQLPDPAAVQDGFLDQFGRPIRESPCACERRNEMNLAQAMALVNGPTVSNAVSNPQGRVAQLIKADLGHVALVEELYLAVLCRLPTAEEKVNCVTRMLMNGNKLESAQDLLWALLNSPEFLFNR